jgi:hypothetical protein
MAKSTTTGAGCVGGTVAGGTVAGGTVAGGTVLGGTVVGATGAGGTVLVGATAAGLDGAEDEEDSDDEDVPAAAGVVSSSRSRAAPMVPTTRNRARTANQGRWYTGLSRGGCGGGKAAYCGGGYG